MKAFTGIIDFYLTQEGISGHINKKKKYIKVYTAIC